MVILTPCTEDDGVCEVYIIHLMLLMQPSCIVDYYIVYDFH